MQLSDKGTSTAAGKSIRGAKLGRSQIAIRFVAFAGIATLVNLATQELTLRAIPAAPLMLSILAGTAGGFLVKYLLDKWYVFYDVTGTPIDEARKVTIYAVCSVLTTGIFWAVELWCWTIWGTSFAKYAGAVAGLAIGYAIKYYLDLKFVFKQQDA